MQGIQNIDDIIDVSDGIMIAEEIWELKFTFLNYLNSKRYY